MKHHQLTGNQPSVKASSSIIIKHHESSLATNQQSSNRDPRSVASHQENLQLRLLCKEFPALQREGYTPPGESLDAACAAEAQSCIDGASCELTQPFITLSSECLLMVHCHHLKQYSLWTTLMKVNKWLTHGERSRVNTWWTALMNILIDWLVVSSLRKWESQAWGYQSLRKGLPWTTSMGWLLGIGESFLMLLGQCQHLHLVV